MSRTTKLMMSLMLAMPVATFAQNIISVSDHTVNVWQAKALFWSEWQLQYQANEAIADTWQAKGPRTVTDEDSWPLSILAAAW